MELLEKLAKLEHDQWIAWSSYIASSLHDVDDQKVKDLIKRWSVNWVPYEQLSEEMKEKDRKWARMALEAMEKPKDKLVINIDATSKFSAEEAIKFRSGMALLQKVLNSEIFKQRFLKAKFTEARGMTNMAIYEKVMSGADKFDKVKDGELDVHITMYYSARNVIGYTYPSTWYTWINRRYFRSFDLPSICGNVFHEYLHNCGFGHLKRWKRKSSVPYRGGYLARDVAKTMI